MSNEQLTLVFTGLGAVATIVAAVGVWWAARTYKFNTWLKAQSIYIDQEFYKARNTVLSHFPFDKNTPPSFDGPDKDHALLVCRKMDELAHLKSYVGEEKIIEVWGQPMGKSWMILTKLIDKVREQDKYPKKWNAFQHLAEKAITRHKLKELNENLLS